MKNKLVLWPCLQNSLSKPASEQSTVLDFMSPQEALLTLPPHADAVLKYNGWHAGRQYCRKSTLKVSWWTATPKLLYCMPFLLQTSKLTWAWDWHQTILDIYSS